MGVHGLWPTLPPPDLSGGHPLLHHHDPNLQSEMDRWVSTAFGGLSMTIAKNRWGRLDREMKEHGYRSRAEARKLSRRKVIRYASGIYPFNTFSATDLADFCRRLPPTPELIACGSAVPNRRQWAITMKVTHFLRFFVADGTLLRESRGSYRIPPHSRPRKDDSNDQ